jgi:hypothetical protein
MGNFKLTSIFYDDDRLKPEMALAKKGDMP